MYEEQNIVTFSNVFDIPISFYLPRIYLFNQIMYVSFSHFHPLKMKKLHCFYVAKFMLTRDALSEEVFWQRLN